MKLPGIDYGTPNPQVQLETPQQAAAIYNAAGQGVGQLATQFAQFQKIKAEAEALSGASEVNNELQTLSQKLQGRRAIDLFDPEIPESIREKYYPEGDENTPMPSYLKPDFDEATGQHKLYIDSSMIMGELYEAKGKEIIANRRKSMSKTGARELDTVVGKLFNAELGKVLAKQTEWEMERVQGDFNNSLDQAVEAMDTAGGLAILQRGLDTGVWGPTEALKKHEEFQVAVDHRRIAVMIDTGDYEEAKNYLLYQPHSLDAAQVNSQLDNVERAQDKAKQEEKELKAEASKRAANAIRTDVVAKNIPLSDSQLKKLQVNLRPEEYTDILTFNEVQKNNRYTKGNEEALNKVKMRVLGVGFPQGDTSFESRVRIARKQIYEAAGYNYDKGTYDETKVPLLTAKDMVSALELLDAQVEAPFKGASYNQARRAIEWTLTKSSSENWGLNPDDVNVINAQQALADFHAHLQNQPPDYNPQQWVDEHLDDYLLPAYRTNEESLNVERASAYLTQYPTDPVKAVNESALPDKEKIKVINEILKAQEVQRLRAKKKGGKK